MKCEFESYHQVTRTLDSLFHSGYSKEFRPGVGGPPTQVDLDHTGCHKKITNRMLLELCFRAINYPAVQPTNHFCISIPRCQVEVNLAIRSMGPVDERREEFTFDCYFRSSVSSFHVVFSIWPVYLMLRW